VKAAWAKKSWSEPFISVAPERILLSLPWKGNIRELDNVIERAMILGDSEWITPADLPRDAQLAVAPTVAVGRSLKESLTAYEKLLIENALRETGGDRLRTATLLGVSRSSLYRKIEQLGIPLAFHED
jgi:DNA-binding NtrC family response regulator